MAKKKPTTTKTPSKVSRTEFAKEMEIIAQGGDPEGSHCDGDKLMLETLRSLGYGAGCDIFESMPKWYA